MAFEFERVVAALLVLVATGLSVVLVRTLGLEALRQTTPGREHILASALQLALVAMGVGSAVWLLNVNAAIVLTLVAILSAGISLALDRSAQDVIAGVKLALSGYVREGQYVVIGDHEGRVAEMGLFSLTLVTSTRTGIVLSNSAVVGQVMQNKSLYGGQAVDVTVTLQRGGVYNRERVRAVLRSAAGYVDEAYGDQVIDPSVYLRELGMWGDVWRVRVYVGDELSASFVRDALAQRVAEELEEAGFALGTAQYVQMA